MPDGVSSESSPERSDAAVGLDLDRSRQELAGRAGFQDHDHQIRRPRRGYPGAGWPGSPSFLGLDSNHDAIARAVEAADFQNLQRQEAASGFRERPEGMPRFFRRGRAGGWRDSLTPLQAARIEQDHGELMDSLNYVRIRTFSAG